MRVVEIPLQGVPSQTLLVPSGAEAYKVFADARGPYFQYVETGELSDVMRVTIAQVKTEEEVPYMEGYLTCYLGSYFYKYRFHAFWYCRYDGS